MKGLLVKDLRLVFTMKQQLLLFLGVCALIAFSSDGSFVIGYTAGLMGILSLSTLAFDEYDNGFPFLFSLPVDVKTYVNEKYLFCILLDLAGMALGTVFFLLSCLTKNGMDKFLEDVVHVAFYFPLTLLLLLSLLPIQMIFGREKSRIVTFVLYGLLFGLSAVVVKVFEKKDLSGSLEWLRNPFVLAGAAFALMLTVCSALYLVCLKAMRKKEF